MKHMPSRCNLIDFLYYMVEINRSTQAFFSKFLTYSTTADLARRLLV